MTSPPDVAAVQRTHLERSRAKHWPHGALRWRTEHHITGSETVTPLSSLAREALDVYLARNPRAGDLLLFPELRRPNDCASRGIAEHWLRQAEKKAGLPRLARGGYHAFRRQFALERHHLFDTDVMAAAGWLPRRDAPVVSAQLTY